MCDGVDGGSESLGFLLEHHGDGVIAAFFDLDMSGLLIFWFYDCDDGFGLSEFDFLMGYLLVLLFLYADAHDIERIDCKT